MVRTQIYLTEHQRLKLAAISRSVGKKQSLLIREAVDRFIEHAGRKRRDLVLRETAGIWKSRKDLPEFETVRSAWDRCEQ